MTKCLIKIKDKYFEWSTVSDSPITYGMSKTELRDHIKEEYGNDGIDALPKRLKRISINGTSAIGETLSETTSVNRAGESETCITIQQIYDRYKIKKEDV